MGGTYLPPCIIISPSPYISSKIDMQYVGQVGVKRVLRSARCGGSRPRWAERASPPALRWWCDGRLRGIVLRPLPSYGGRRRSGCRAREEEAKSACDLTPVDRADSRPHARP